MCSSVNVLKFLLQFSIGLLNAMQKSKVIVSANKYRSWHTNLE
ncbi:unnamed protein product [Paramecium primaurelia]|uniref:Uncharacterized protein n=1 Tax=Paramecium primaurelia TaxID=5886 RepID=A0A8S1QTS1_PARPR|nr:unnamed protein product [Paramecium primaurelia]CAD8118639.1 unnamed protein product [Paramecium primaurelia]